MSAQEVAGLALALALCGCSERFDPSLDWQCRLTTGETVTISGEDRRDPKDWGGTDTNGWRWKQDHIATCRILQEQSDAE